jgi:DNA-3-methyladenine glycosylase II
MVSRKAGVRDAADRLAAEEPVIARLIAKIGYPAFPRAKGPHFAALVRIITYQQLAGPAARAIHGRLEAALHDEVTPERLLTLSVDQLRAVGMSANKTASLRDLATKVLDGTVVVEPRRLARLEDDEVIRRLSAVRGIGEWTAQIFLMLNLHRLDVWPTGDLGVRKGFGVAWSIPTPSPKQLYALGEPYRPYRSVVAWYCWRAAELEFGTAATEVTGARS